MSKEALKIKQRKKILSEIIEYIFLKPTLPKDHYSISHPTLFQFQSNFNNYILLEIYLI